MGMLRAAARVACLGGACLYAAGDRAADAESSQVVRAPDGAYIEVPAGALPGDAKVEIRVGSTRDGGKLYELSPHGVLFAKPVRIHLPLDASARDDVRLCTRERRDAEWMRLDAHVDTRERMVVADVRHFSFFTPSGVMCPSTCTGAKTWVVSTCADTADPNEPCNPASLTSGSLREALCGVKSCDLVTFKLPPACNDTITLVGPSLQVPAVEITIDGDPSLNGGTQGRTTIDGSGLVTMNGSYPVNLTLSGDDTTVRNLVITGAQGALLNAGDGLTLLGRCELVEGNVLSGNAGEAFLGIGMSQSWIRGNFIGVRADGVTPWPNGKGMRITGGDNRIGGPSAQDANVIAMNQSVGVSFHGPAAVGNVVTQNAISGNGVGFNLYGGILLQAGANHGVIPPLITTRTPSVVGGTTSAPTGSIVELFGDTGLEGRSFLCSVPVSAGTFAAIAGVGACPAQFPTADDITATVTSPIHDTSMFSGLDCSSPPAACSSPSTVVQYDASTTPDMATVPWIPLGLASSGADTNSVDVAGGVLTFHGGTENTGVLLQGRGAGYLRSDPTAATATSIDFSAQLAIPATNALFTGTDNVSATSYAALIVSDSSRIASLSFAILSGTKVISTRNVDPDDHPALGDPSVLPLDWTQAHAYAIHVARCGAVTFDVDNTTVFSTSYGDLGSNAFPLTVGFFSGTCESEWTSAHYEICVAGSAGSSTSSSSGSTASSGSSGSSGSGGSTASSGLGGSGGSISSSGSGDSTSSSGSGGGGTTGAKGCGCGVAASRARGAWWLSVGFLVLLITRRRHRRVRASGGAAGLGVAGPGHRVVN